jgi:hypothetical protein
MVNSNTTTDTMDDDNLTGCFRAALEEEGVENFDILREDYSFTTRFVITKYLRDGKPIRKRVELSDMMQSEQKQIAMTAKKIARSIRSEIVQIIECDGYRNVEFSVEDGGWARCRICDSDVTSPQKQTAVWSESEPAAMNAYRDTSLKSVDGLSEVLFELYLIGSLNEECFMKGCQRSTERFK